MPEQVTYTKYEFLSEFELMKKSWRGGHMAQKASADEDMREIERKSKSRNICALAFPRRQDGLMRKQRGGVTTRSYTSPSFAREEDSTKHTRHLLLTAYDELGPIPAGQYSLPFIDYGHIENITTI